MRRYYNAGARIFQKNNSGGEKSAFAPFFAARRRECAIIRTRTRQRRNHAMKILIVIVILIVGAAGYFYQSGDMEYWYAVHRLEKTAAGGGDALRDPGEYVNNLNAKARAKIEERCNNEVFNNWLRTRGIDDVPQDRDAVCAALFENNWIPPDRV
jgi:hypothetical protein